MTSPFAAAARAADATIDQVYQEPVLVQPQLGGEYVTTDDPDRPAYAAQMIVGMYPTTVTFKYVGKYDADKPQISADEIHVWAHEDKLPADRTQWPKKDDRLILTDRPNEHGLLIQAVEPDGVGRWMYRCIRTPLP